MAESIAQVGVRAVVIPGGGVALDADLVVPRDAGGVVVFAHGTGSGRHSPRNRRVASVLAEAGLATLLMDLLTPEEERVDARTAELRFDIDLLGRRTTAAVDETAAMNPSFAIGCFGASTGAAAALVAAAERPDVVRAVVSRGGRPDLAGPALGRVRAPTLLMVGGHDQAVIGLNRQAMSRMRCEVELEVIEGATHLFEEPGKLEQVALLAGRWFRRHLETSSD